MEASAFLALLGVVLFFTFGISSRLIWCTFAHSALHNVFLSP